MLTACFMLAACNEKRICSGANDVCTNNYCLPSCAELECKEGLTCYEGYCQVSCETSIDCLAGYNCEGNVCQSSRVKGQLLYY